MNVLQAAKSVLQEAKKPLHYKEITRRMIDRGLWQTDGKTPDATVSATITGDIKKNGAHALFQRTDEGVYALSEWGSPGFDAPSESANTEDGTYKPTPGISTAKPLSFTDAAEQVLRQFSDSKPMHYREITRKALELDLIKTKGLTPEATLYSQILAEIRRQTRRGDMPRFIMQRGGLVSLSSWRPIEIEESGLVAQIEQHNQQARKKFHERLLSMHPKAFVELIGQLLAAIGFEDVIVRDFSGDGGIDVRGTLVVGDVISINMAVQVKRWKGNVQAPIVREVRGSLGTHNQGLIITTSDFSSGAVEEARLPNKVPVGLMNGDQLVALLVEHNIGVHRTPYQLIELGETDE